VDGNRTVRRGFCSLCRIMNMHASGLVERVRGEFNEMPGLQLTIAQAARLWGMDLRACRDVIDALVDTAFLRWTQAGTIVRAEH
jgi:hypothetical protein